MSCIWTFGDSFTSSFDMKGWWIEEYVKFKGYIPKFFGQIIAEKYNYELKNFGGYGDNDTIFGQFLDNMDYIKNGDVILFGWSDICRFRLVNTQQNRWEIIYPNRGVDARHGEFSEITLNEILVNRTHKLYVEEHKKLMRFITNSLKNNFVLHWDWARWDILPCETIYKETNGQIEDHHWSESGHQTFANFFFDVYENNKTVEF